MNPDCLNPIWAVPAAIGLWSWLITSWIRAPRIPSDHPDGITSLDSRENG